MTERKYMGEFDVQIESSPYASFTPRDWAMAYMFRYGQIDGAHHKQWVLDQVARILKGTEVIVKLAKWDDGEEEYRFNTAENPSQEYLDWVIEYKGDDNDEDNSYEYNEGIPP